MFQFRAFPSYAYFIQRTIRRYCLRGFPHSEISGSMDICSSPKLIAACHVLLRLLMPRHSPCALSSLTSENFWFPLVELCRQSTNRLEIVIVPTFRRHFIILLTQLACINSAILHENARKYQPIFPPLFASSCEIPAAPFARQYHEMLPTDVPQLKFKLFQLSLKDLSVALLSSLSFHCSVFKVQSPASVETR